MKLLQSLILIVLLSSTLAAPASWLTEPYIGYGQLSLKLGDEVIINGEATSYILGAKTGFQIGQNIYIAADYSRAGPYEIKFKQRYYGASIDSGYFNLYSGGIGVEYNFGTWMLWYGLYPYHVLAENKIDFQLKGQMKRLGLGFSLDAKTKLYFNYENSSLRRNRTFILGTGNLHSIH